MCSNAGLRRAAVERSMMFAASPIALAALAQSSGLVDARTNAKHVLVAAAVARRSWDPCLA